jgi:plastocyanin
VTAARPTERSRLRPFFPALLATMGLLLLAGTPARGADVVMIDVSDFAYQPQTITIQVGDTIQWNNSDGVDHTATSVDGSPAAFDVYLAAGAWGSQTFDTPGTYDYYCIPHPFMTGSIVVEAAPAPGGGGTGVPDVAMSRPADGGLTIAAGAALILLAAAWLIGRQRRRLDD